MKQLIVLRGCRILHRIEHDLIDFPWMRSVDSYNSCRTSGAYRHDVQVFERAEICLCLFHDFHVFLYYYYILNQWIVLLTHFDWLLKLGIVSCYLKLAEVANEILNLFSSLGFLHVCIKIEEEIFISCVQSSCHF